MFTRNARFQLIIWPAKNLPNTFWNLCFWDTHTEVRTHIHTRTWRAIVLLCSIPWNECANKEMGGELINPRSNTYGNDKSTNWMPPHLLHERQARPHKYVTWASPWCTVHIRSQLWQPIVDTWQAINSFPTSWLSKNCLKPKLALTVQADINLLGATAEMKRDGQEWSGMALWGTYVYKAIPQKMRLLSYHVQSCNTWKNNSFFRFPGFQTALNQQKKPHLSGFHLRFTSSFCRVLGLHMYISVSSRIYIYRCFLKRWYPQSTPTWWC